MYYISFCRIPFCNLLIVLIGISGLAFGQDKTPLSGRIWFQVENQPPEPTPQARIWWTDSDPVVGSLSDGEGNFSIPPPHHWPARLSISSVVFADDTLQISSPDELKNLTVSSILQTETVDVKGKQNATSMSMLETRQVEQLNQREFRKAACCNLSESFETNATVDVAYPDAITGLREIQMLGLSGRFVQLMYENQPGIRGLGTAWGLTFTPGPWVNSVRLNKGTGSVVNGYESMVGQIDIALKSPETSDALYVNLYGNTNSRHEGNLILSRKLNDTWSTTLLTHGSRLTAANDFNSDGFYDTPTSQQVSVGNRWQFQTSDWEGQFGVYATSDDRRGGSISFDKEKPQNAQNIYGFEQYTRRIMAWSKTGKVLDEAGDKSFGLQTQWVVHDQQGSFGLKNYTGLQRSAQINAIYQTPISGKAHQLRTGASYLFDETNQTFNDSLMPRTEHVPGVFGEYVFSPNLRWSIVAGMRLDQHNLYGTWFTPRLHARYNANEKWTFRLSSGRGRRVPNLLLEQQTLLTSGRELRFQEGLREEDAWNSGIGVSRQFVWQGRAGQITADFYRTDFINRSVTDFDFSDTLILVRNLVGESRSNAFQIQVQQEVLKNFDVRVAYKYLDVQTTTAGELRPDLLQAVHRGFVNMSYEWRRFEFDGTLHIYGKQRLPLRTSELGNEFPDWAPAFVNINAQINYKVGQWIFFIGSENLSGTRQQIALRGTDQPLSTAFDTSYGWGPLMGPLFYAGLHFSLPQWGDRKGKSN